MMLHLFINVYQKYRQLLSTCYPDIDMQAIKNRKLEATATIDLEDVAECDSYLLSVKKNLQKR